MADEISQVVELEYKGLYYLFKGTTAMIAAMARMIKSLQNWQNERYLKKPGNCTWGKIQEISDGTPPILEFPKEMFESKPVGKDDKGNIIYGKSDFDLYCEKYKLRYCIMPDLNPNDDYIPVAIPIQDMGIHQEQIKAVMGRRIKQEEAKDSEYDEKINVLKEKILNSTSEKEKAEAEEQLKMMEDAKAQNEHLLKESKAKADCDNVLDFADYLKQGENTLIETEPDLALKMENECGIIKEYKPYDCMWPIRDAELIPKSREIYYSQKLSDNKIHYILRKIMEDEHGNVYSEYHVRIPGTFNEKVFSDYGLSQKEWEIQLPNVLKEGGLIIDQPITVVQSQERFMAYLEFIDDNFNDARKEITGKDQDYNYSSPEAKEFIEKHNEKEAVKKAYEESQFTSMKVSVDKLMYDESDILCLQTEDGLLKGVILDSIDDKFAEIFIQNDATYTLIQPDGKHIELSGSAILSNNIEPIADVMDKVSKVKGR